MSKIIALPSICRPLAAADWVHEPRHHTGRFCPAQGCSPEPLEAGERTVAVARSALTGRRERP
jgi:hypothetical protein